MMCLYKICLFMVAGNVIKMNTMAGNPHIVIFFWIPAFAGMTMGLNINMPVIPAKAGIQEVWPGFIENIRNP